ncbi:DNA damage-regulated autophagy modulator protein 2 isoform X2 [Dermacentor silvarum]|uniref:DNA damage-regulated autophagy modulator protein 2 isoform X2 n=1 Tax=Dermacentor silvarum TaxID=543639 RepID=UPI002100B1E5|nr:DNA damage-regulated autophagy modulator protein 2 isoform X2 [Dermacentor silvarum]
MRHVGVGWIPLVFGVVLAGGTLLTFVWAIARGDVTPYLPFVSEAGADPPQSGFFSLCLFVAATFGLKCLLVRYQTVRSFNASCSKKLDAMNGAAAIVALVSFIGMATVASFPVMQTVITYWMYPNFNGKVIVIVRILITCVSGVSVVLMGALGSVGRSTWKEKGYDHPIRQKVPSDEGFGLLVSAAAFEWILGLCLVLFFFTFVREFHKVTLEIKADLLVDHLDDEPIFRKSPYMSETTYLRAHET